MNGPRRRFSLLVCATIYFHGCAETVVRRPDVPAGSKVQELRRTAGDAAQDCGEAIEPKTGATCDVHPVGECLAAALHDCRAAYGARSHFTAESDAIRIDWLVIPDPQSTCHLAVVEDRSADPLAPRAPTVKNCKALVWKPHESVPNCDAPLADRCGP
jgi:hypothetical protein